jgi:hypothetical protein
VALAESRDVDRDDKPERQALEVSIQPIHVR